MCLHRYADYTAFIWSAIRLLNTVPRMPSAVFRNKMNPTIIAAIIAGAVAIVAPLIALFAKDYLAQKPLGRVIGRRKALVGKWKGSLKEEAGIGGSPLEIEVTVEFTKQGKRILGSAMLTRPGSAPRHLAFIGGFFHDQFVKLEYTNPDPTIIQFGSYVAKLAADPRILEGRFVGYGPATDAIVHGTATLEKQAS